MNRSRYGIALLLTALNCCLFCCGTVQVVPSDAVESSVL